MEHLTTSEPLPPNSIKNIWINLLLKYNAIDKIQLDPATNKAIDIRVKPHIALLLLSGTIITSLYLNKRLFHRIDRNKE